MKRRLAWAAIAFAASMTLTALTYNFVCWYYFRGYNEVLNMFVSPAVSLLVIVNLVAAGILWAIQYYRRDAKNGLLIASFMLAALMNLISPLVAPSIGRFANRKLWIDTPLIEAARYGDEDTVISLVESGEPVDITAFGTTPLHYMAYGGNLAAVELLLSKGANPNATENVSLETPLHWAVRARTDLDIIQTLVAHGASTNAADHEGRTPIDYTDTIPEPQASDIRTAMNGSRP
jgi:Ankyrin repeats (3 copies)